MSASKTDAAQRLERLEVVFASRRARLASEIARPPARIDGAAPLVRLQHHGYAVALLLALTALLPTVVGFAFRRRKLLFGAVAAGLRARKLQARVDAVRTTGSRR